MNIIRKILKSPVPVALFFLGIFKLSVFPLRDFDIWFHVKSGEIIAKMGIIHYDVFSHSAAGREWFPYEWLFQWLMYQVQQFFGFEAIKYVTACIILIQIFILYCLFRQIFNLNRFFSALLSFFFFVSVFEFYSARPHVWAYTFLLAYLYLVLLYFFRGKNWLLLTIPITILWSNMHGSIFLAVFLAGAYGVLSYMAHKSHETNKPNEKNYGGSWKVFGIYTLISAVLTILPPLGILQYRLLWIFFRDNTFISNFIDEWAPLTVNPTGMVVYTSTVVLFFLLVAVTVIKTGKKPGELVWTFPLLPLIPLAYTASRNVFLGYIAMAVVAGWCLSRIEWGKIRGWGRVVTVAAVTVLIIVHVYELLWKMTPQRFYYPVEAAKFIKKNLKGNMFNEYGYGGYLLYQLYPVQKVFIDGRTDVYLCCEMRDMLTLSTLKNYNDEDYKKIVLSMFDKYKISFILMRTQKHQVLRRIARILTDDGQWSLVFWDDFSQIFVRRDGKNDEVIARYGALAATPYNRNPFREKRENEALEEYQRMIGIVDSAKSRNAVGYIYLTKNDLAGAKSEFEKAVRLDPQFESPYMNLAEIYAGQGDLKTAIWLYTQAKILASDRGLVYQRLGELYLQSGMDKQKALEIWNEGIKNTIDDEAREKLKKLVGENT